VVNDWLDEYVASRPSSIVGKSEMPGENGDLPSISGKSEMETREIDHELRKIVNEDLRIPPKKETKTTERADRSPAKRHVRHGTPREESSSSFFSGVVDEEGRGLEKEGTPPAVPSRGNGHRYGAVESDIDAILEEFGPFNDIQRRNISDWYEEDPDYVLSKVPIVKSEPRGSLARAFQAALRDNWQPKKGTARPNPVAPRNTSTEEMVAAQSHQTDKDRAVIAAGLRQTRLGIKAS